MNRDYRSKWLTMMMVTVLLIMSACGSSQESKSNLEQLPVNSQADASLTNTDVSDQKTRTIKTINGEIEIPAHPERIVAQGYLATFLALGVKPIGAPFWDIDSPHIKHMTSGIEDIGAVEISSTEKILSLAPDLIVTLSDDPAIYEKLSKIAPTIVYPFNTFEDARDEIRTFGELLGKSTEAETWIAEFNTTVRRAKDQIKNVVGPNETVSVIGGFNDKIIYVYSYGGWRGVQAIYKHLELKPPLPIQKMIDEKVSVKEISLEAVPEYAGDYIFLDAGNNGQFERDGSFWKSIPAVKNHRVYDVDGNYFWPYDPIAIQAQVQKVAEILVQGRK